MGRRWVAGVGSMMALWVVVAGAGTAAADDVVHPIVDRLCDIQDTPVCEAGEYLCQGVGFHAAVAAGLPWLVESAGFITVGTGDQKHAYGYFAYVGRIYWPDGNVRNTYWIAGQIDVASKGDCLEFPQLHPTIPVAGVETKIF